MPAPKGFKDFMPELALYRGVGPLEFGGISNPFEIPAEFLVRQLIANLANKAHEWYQHYFAYRITSVAIRDIRIERSVLSLRLWALRANSAFLLN